MVMGIVEQQINSVMRKIVKEVKDANTAALNDAAKSALGAGMRAIAKEYPYKVSDLRKKMRVVRAQQGQDYVNVRIFDNVLPLIKLTKNWDKRPARYKNKRRKKVGGVRVKAGRGKTIKYPGAFVQRMKSGHIGVFMEQEGEKASTGRPKINQLYGPQILAIYETEWIQGIIQEKFYEQYEKRLAHYMQRMK